MSTAATIAAGGEPAWERTFTHPTLGELTFVVKRTPTVQDWLAHAAMQEQIAPGLTPGLTGPSVLAAAVAGLLTFVERPVVAEDRKDDPNDPTHITVTKVYYDPLQEEHIEFPTEVWTAFVTWRLQLLSEVDEVKNSSGATSGRGSADASPAGTDSPPTTRE